MLNECFLRPAALLLLQLLLLPIEKCSVLSLTSISRGRVTLFLDIVGVIVVVVVVVVAAEFGIRVPSFSSRRD